MRKQLSGSEVLFMTDYRGLTAEQINELRGGFRKIGIQFRVVKNNLLKRAAEGTDFAPVVGEVVGPTGVVISRTDPVEASKVLVEYMAKFNVLSFKMGVLNGEEDRRCGRQVYRQASGPRGPRGQAPRDNERRAGRICWGAFRGNEEVRVCPLGR